MDEFTIFLKAIDVFNTLALLDFSYLLTEELFLRGGHRWRLVDIFIIFKKRTMHTKKNSGQGGHDPLL